MLALAVDGVNICYPRGLLDHLAHLTDDPALVEPLHLRSEDPRIGVAIAIAHAHDRGQVQGFVNLAACGGGHVDGLIAGMRAAFRGRAPWPALAPHLIAIVHLILEQPNYNSNRSAIFNREVEPIVVRMVERGLLKHFEQAPAFLDAILLAT